MEIDDIEFEKRMPFPKDATSSAITQAIGREVAGKQALGEMLLGSKSLSEVTMANKQGCQGFKYCLVKCIGLVNVFVEIFLWEADYPDSSYLSRKVYPSP